jgi:hypothetical protein
MAAPLTTFAGFLKQIDRASMDDIAKCVLDRAFPFFWPGSSENEDIRAQTRVLEQRGADYIFHDLSPPRRLAGCWGLPRGRYFSLSIDEIGDDFNTLANELNAYLDPLRGGLILFADMAVQQAREQLAEHLSQRMEPGPHIIVVLLGRPSAINPVIDALDKRGLIPSEANEQRVDSCLIGTHIPYQVVPRDIPNTFDLRLLECQEYLVREFFKKDTEKLKKRDRSGIDTFVEALPILMYPALGGGPMAEGNGAILQSLASFIREQGANALVYPSARSDVLAEVRAGKLHKWRGWCLVDYTGAQEPLVAQTVDFSAGWSKAFPTGAQLRWARGASSRVALRLAGS